MAAATIAAMTSQRWFSPAADDAHGELLELFERTGAICSITATRQPLTAHDMLVTRSANQGPRLAHGDPGIRLVPARDLHVTAIVHGGGEARPDGSARSAGDVCCSAARGPPLRSNHRRSRRGGPMGRARLQRRAGCNRPARRRAPCRGSTCPTSRPRSLSAASAGEATLFIEVPAAAFLVPGAVRHLCRLAADTHVDPRRLVVQVSNHLSIDDFASLPAIVAELHAAGFRVSSKDAATQSSNLLRVAEMRPDFIKVGAHLVGGVHSSEARRATVVSLLSFSTHINAPLIAEGIDDAADLRTLLDLGIQFGQGDHLDAEVTAPLTSDGGARSGRCRLVDVAADGRLDDR